MPSSRSFPCSSSQCPPLTTSVDGAESLPRLPLTPRSERNRAVHSHQPSSTQAAVSVMKSYKIPSEPAQVPLGAWPSSLPVPAPTNNRIRSQNRTKRTGDHHTAAGGIPSDTVANLERMLVLCPLARELVQDCLDMAAQCDTLTDRAAECEIANFVSRELGMIVSSRLEPVDETARAWEDARAETARVAEAAEATAAESKRHLQELVAENVVEIDDLIREAEAPNALLNIAQRRYSLVHDRLATASLASAGLHEAREKLQSLTRVRFQLTTETKSLETEILRLQEAAQRASEREKRTREECQQLIARETANLQSLCLDVDFADRTEESLKFRLESEQLRSADIEQDIAQWTAKLADGRIEDNAALTPRPKWSSLDVAQWGVTFRPSLPAAESVPDTDAILRARREGGAGFASPIELSTTKAIELVSQRCVEQQRVSRLLLDDISTLRRAASTILGSEQFATAATFSLSAIPTFLAKGDGIAFRSVDGILLPTVQWTPLRLACVCCNFMKAAYRFLPRSSDESSMSTAVQSLIDATDEANLSTQQPQPRNRSGSILGDFLTTDRRSHAARFTASRFRGTIEDQLLGDWPWLPASRESPSGHRIAGADNVSRIYRQCYVQTSRATLESNPIAYAAAECFAGRLPPRIFALHSSCMEKIMSLMATLRQGERRRNGLTRLEMDAVVRGGCTEYLPPASAARVAILALRDAELLLSLRSVTGRIAQALMEQLLDQQSKLSEILTRAIGGASYHDPSQPRVWFYAAEFEVLTLSAGGILVSGAPDSISSLSRALSEPPAAGGDGGKLSSPHRPSHNSMKDSPATDRAVGEARRVLRFNLAAFLEHVTQHVTKAEVDDVFPQLALSLERHRHPHRGAGVGAAHSYDLSSVHAFLQQIQQPATKVALQNSNLALISLVDKQRGKTTLPCPQSVRTLRESLGDSDGGVSLAEYCTTLFDAREVIGRLRTVWLPAYTMPS